MTADGLVETIEAFRVLPVAVLDDPATAEPLADALVAGGLPCLEITLRTSGAEAAISAVAGRSDMVVGAGTVVTPEQVTRAADAGARFVVSPGFSLDVVQRAEELGLLAIPGVATASDVQSAVQAGLHAVKLFPADVLGGLRIVNALAAPFPDVRFMPSGGVSASNAADYLAHPAVFAVSGSWMIPRAQVAGGEFDEVRRQVASTVSLLVEAEGSLG